MCILGLAVDERPRSGRLTRRADGHFRKEAHRIRNRIGFRILIHSTVICLSKAWLYAFRCVSFAIPLLQVLRQKMRLARLSKCS